ESGVLIHLTNHNTFKALGNVFELMNFGKSAGSWCKFSTEALNKSLNKIMDDLKTTIIMPAGNVFEFSGIDVDEAGHVYTRINYK
ncbi:hypothetical protein K440DRAFT_489096, partial [Wilcoxina mikolae CBS 423.85]